MDEKVDYVLYVCFSQFPMRLSRKNNRDKQGLYNQNSNKDTRSSPADSSNAHQRLRAKPTPMPTSLEPVASSAVASSSAQVIPPLYSSHRVES